MREACKSDRPKIGSNQTQCVICWRMFASDSLCERSKPYARLPEEEVKKGRVAVRSQCIDPLDLGLIAQERPDGVAVWGLCTDEETERRLGLLAKARASRARSKN